MVMTYRHIPQIMLRAIAQCTEAIHVIAIRLAAILNGLFGCCLADSSLLLLIKRAVLLEGAAISDQE